MHLVDDPRDDRKAILEADGEIAIVGFRCQEVDVVDCSVLREIHAGIVSGIVAICVVGVDAVAAFGNGEVEARGHYVADVGGGGVEPEFAGPALEGIAVVGGVEGGGIGTPIFVGASGEVAYAFNVVGGEGGDGGFVGVEEVEVYDRDAWVW